MNILDHPILFLPPARIANPFGWVGHIPFAMLLVELAKPRLIVELGTHSGNSFNAFCQAVNLLKLPTRCFAVDTWEGDPHAGTYSEDIYNSLQTYVGIEYPNIATLLRMTFDTAIPHFEDGSIDILHIDGLHTYEAVRHDFENWQSKLSDRAIVLFHDTHVRQDDFGVWQLWDELKTRYPSIEFPHSNGLGVLLVGRLSQGILQPLTAMDATAWLNFQHLAERIGRGLAMDEQFAIKQDEIRGLVAHIHELNLEYQATQRTLEERLLQQEARVQQAEHRLGEVMAEKNNLLQRYEQMKLDCTDLSAQIAAIQASTSWRVTAPLRTVSRLVARLRGAVR